MLQLGERPRRVSNWGITGTHAYFPSCETRNAKVEAPAPPRPAAIGHSLLGDDYARGKFELKDDPAGVAAGGGALRCAPRMLDFKFPSRSVPPSKQ
jgi:hypothetical protein